MGYGLKLAKTICKGTRIIVRIMDKDSEAADLSEGEIVDSSESSPSSTSDRYPTDTVDCQVPRLSPLGEEEPPPPSKKKKTKQGRSYSEPALYWKSDRKNDDSALTGRQRKRKKKQELRRLEIEKKQLQSIAEKAAQSGEAQLTIQQTNVLQGLIKLSQGESSATNLPKLKTSSFQGLVSHLVTGNPTTRGQIVGDIELRKNRIVVAWLSLVSEEFFSSSDSHFPKLKSLNPALLFKIEHPGSARFAKLGLESFMCSSTNGEPSKPRGLSQQGGAKLTRQSYLLSKDQLIEHGFPVPGFSNTNTSYCSFPQADVSSYINITAWPEVEPRVKLAEDAPKEIPMFAVDCEMVETKIGSELARVSIVDETLTCVYDTLVKPDNPVTDYRTKYSGIDEDLLEDVTITLSEVQEMIRDLLPPNSILIGHSLDNDFHALHLSHPYVIDTSCIFTPGSSPTNKPGLRRLAKELLSTEIQGGSSGHDSIEDASTCMKLVQLKIRTGPSCVVAFNQFTPSIITEYRTQGKNAGMVDRAGVVRLFGRGATCSYEVETDNECIEKAIEIIPQCDYTFLQLHDMEMHLKINGSDKTDQDVADTLDSNVVKLVEGCPDDTLVFVVCGSSDIREVKELQKDDFVDVAKLKKVVLGARTGMVVSFIVS